ncbi:MAG: transketolase [Desulfobacterales bacterium]|jgi:transketolase
MNETDGATVCINTIRMLAADAVEQANSGHPGMPMGAAPMAYVLWRRHLRHNPKNPGWPDRDRFVLSAGHGSMLLYALLYLTGYDLSLDELKNFRQWGSKTPGHPEFGHPPGVETTTGPLGQGFANGVGMAIAERMLAARFNRPGHTVVDHFTYGIVSDGDLMEGISHEAASLAGHLGLGKLIYLYDDNRISIEGDTDLAFSEDRTARFAACGWHVQTVEDGNDPAAIDAAIDAARAEAGRPSLISVRTQIGFGSPKKQGTASAHGEPLGEDELAATKENLGWPASPRFFVPEEALTEFREAVKNGRDLEEDWRRRLAEYEKAHSDLAGELSRRMAGRLSDGWDVDMPVFYADPKGMATRVASGKVLNAIAPHLPELIGGSADLAPSTKTLVHGAADFQKDRTDGRNLRFGVREHAMGGVLNGMAVHGGLIPYGATFLVFSDYMRPPIRLAALMGLHVIYVMTHDSIGLGEDGPTHQPVEQLAALRAMPNLTVVRPADANETAEAWRLAVTRRDGPTLLSLTRQNVPTLDRSRLSAANGLHRGAYVLKEFSAGGEKAILMASGSEVAVALAAAQMLEKEGVSIRVVSVPCRELFLRQPEAYRRRVLPEAVATRVVVEAAAGQGWYRLAGPAGAVISLERFGASAPGRVIYEKFGFTPEAVADRVRSILGKG